MNAFEAGVIARLKTAGLLDAAERAAKRVELRLADCIAPGDVTGGHRALWLTLGQHRSPSQVAALVGFPERDVLPIFRDAIPEPPPEKKPTKTTKRAKAKPQTPLVLPEIPDLEVPASPPLRKTSWPILDTTTRFINIAIRDNVLHHLHAAAERHGVSVLTVIGFSRDARLMRARREVAWRLRVLAGLSSVRIGQILGGRDHTTILHHLRAFVPDAELLALMPGKEAA